MKWISVEDRLPKKYEDVLITNESNEGCRVGFYKSKFEGWYYDGDEIGGITHWMPLPKPPKVQPSLEGFVKYTTGWQTDYYVNRKGEFCSCQNGAIRTQKVGSRGLITYYDNDQKYRKRTKASIIVAKMFIPEFDEETMLAKHKNGDVTDNRVENIYLVKRSEALIETREKHGKR